MQSNGGLIDAAAAADHAAWTVLSGPAGGAAGAAFVARAAGIRDALCFDMGGTSCDVCVVDDGAVQEQSAGEVADRPLALPMLAVHTVGAGGGSIAWRDPGGALRVGPRSAGADPGPACYGRGGTEPTVTDANLVLGYLSTSAPLAGGVDLDLEAAERRDRHSRRRTRAWAARVRRGNRPRRQRRDGARAARSDRPARHRPTSLRAACVRGRGTAARRADRRRAGDRRDRLSARLGRARGTWARRLPSPARRPAQRLPRGRGARGERCGEARQGARRARPTGAERRDAELRAVYELRYRGQAFELAIGGDAEPEIDALRTAFEAEHEDRYGYSDPDEELELVTIRVTATLPGVDVPLVGAADAAEVERSRRQATLGGERVELDVFQGAPPPGSEIEGPAVVELAEATLLVAPGWDGEVDGSGSVRLKRA